MRMIQKTSMQDIADYVGVSKNSVSLSLNNKNGVSDELRARILQAAKELTYAGFAETDNKAVKNNILVLAPDYVVADQFFYQECIWGIEREARLRGCNVVFKGVSMEAERELTLPDTLNETDHVGIILLGLLSRDYIRKLHSTKKRSS